VGHKTTDLLVGVCDEAGVGAHEPRKDALLHWIKAGPGRVVALPGQKLGGRRNNTQPLLARETLLAQSVPAAIVNTCVGVDVRLPNLDRRVPSAERQVHERRLPPALPIEGGNGAID
jgi:hypothetical protein